ncbi:MAG TPA: response regulator transcription factor [Allosphingosinicella sp.]|nr:response regulator transcription factor [Allosphingosinicella sp.]
MIRILLADDHPIIFSGVEALLRGSDYRIVRYVRDGSEVLAAIEAENPDIVILDERLPNRHGLDLFFELRGNGDQRPVVILTGSMSDRRAVEAIDGGVNGLVLKHAAPENLLTCLDEVRSGGRWIEQKLLQRALDRATGRELDGSPFARLTPREQAIVRLAADNLRNQEIGARLGISEGTVKVHLHNVYEKLGLTNRIDLLMLIRDSGISD